MAALENMLFTRTPPTRARLITLYISDFTRIHLRLLGNPLFTNYNKDTLNPEFVAGKAAKV
jgi:hypothetical protein